MSYEDYLQVLLAMEGKQKKLSRGMDMLELNVRAQEGREGFHLDSCIAAAEAVIDVEANHKKTFTAVRRYVYR